MSASTNGSLEAFEGDQKGRFGELIRGHIRNRSVQFVGEETRYGTESIAQRVCDQEDCLHANIDMNPQERERRNIPAGYFEDPNLPEPEKKRCNEEREDHMVASVLAEDGKVESVLVICGRLHAEAIAARLVQSGHHVKMADLRDEDWYIEDWVVHMSNL